MQYFSAIYVGHENRPEKSEFKLRQQISTKLCMTWWHAIKLMNNNKPEQIHWIDGQGFIAKLRNGLGYSIKI